jgi:hypothetical protein
MKVAHAVNRSTFVLNSITSVFFDTILYTSRRSYHTHFRYLGFRAILRRA